MDASPPRPVPPRPVPDRAGRGPVNLERVDIAFGRSAAGVGALFFVQSLPVALGQLDRLGRVWTIASILVLGVALVFVGVATITRRYPRLAAIVFSGVFLVVLLSWPLAVRQPSQDSPWIYLLITVATGLAAYGMPIAPASVYLFAVPIIYAGIRLTYPGGQVGLSRAALDSSYSVILGGAVLIIIVMLRTAAASVDRAQVAALARYTNAVCAHATEAERVRVDAIVHDSVLTTLLSAARAETPEAMSLAATMAGNAIGHLRDAALVSPQQSGAVSVRALVGRVREAVSQLSAPVAVDDDGTAVGEIPTEAAEAILAAVVQAAVNSVNHAGAAAQRRISISGGTDRVAVEVADDGVGFAPGAVPRERLGVRVSIMERTASAGGRARVESEPGKGTVVTVNWPAPEVAAPVSPTPEAVAP